MASDIFTYTGTGTHKFDFWEINGNRDWAVIPAGTMVNFDEDLPIRLQVGHRGFGQIHIEHRHGHWLKKIKKSLQEALSFKLSQPGTIYTTEENNKIKIMMRVNPDSLLVLRYTENKAGNFLTVVSLYFKNERVDGENIGRYIYSFKS